MIIPCFFFPCLLSVRCEIEETLERLKQLERELSCKEQELAERERRLTEWENRLMERSRSCTPVSPHHSVPRITTLLHTVCYIVHDYYCSIILRVGLMPPVALHLYGVTHFSTICGIKQNCNIITLMRILKFASSEIGQTKQSYPKLGLSSNSCVWLVWMFW